ncbi:MAG: RNHCP domain-containing protein [Candidatus Beckwithbacteria bacterium]
MPRHFIKVREDFFCAHCRQPVWGNGYTNHCPHCLYSKHVDELIPGDRNSPCLGLMKPIGLQIKSGKYIIFHQCETCGKITRNKASKNDNHEKLIKFSTHPLTNN